MWDYRFYRPCGKKINVKLRFVKLFGKCDSISTNLNQKFHLNPLIFRIIDILLPWYSVNIVWQIYYNAEKAKPVFSGDSPPVFHGPHSPPRRALPLPKCYSLSVSVELRCQQHAVDFLPGALDFASGKRDGPVGLHAEVNPVVFLIVILRLWACVPLATDWYQAWRPISKRPFRVNMKSLLCK